MYFDRFDICTAYYLYATHYHNGQNSAEYRIFGRLAKIGFSPRVGLELDDLSENERAIYNKLVREGL